MSLKSWDKPLNRMPCDNRCGRVVVSPHLLSESAICSPCLEIERQKKEREKRCQR